MLMGRELLLVVDDNDIVLSALARVLARWPLVLAVDVAEATVALRTRAIDLVVTDLLMPGGSGRDVLDASRRLDPKRPVVLVTGILDYVDPAICNAFDAAFAKPIDSAELVATIGRLLARRHLDG